MLHQHFLLSRKNKIVALTGCAIIILSVVLWRVYQVTRRHPIPTCGDCNVVFVSFDTLRAANVHTLGYTRNTTPTLDSLAEHGFTFTNDISVTSWTLPSTMSWFTGVYPSQHKVLNTVTVQKNGQEIDTSLPTLSPNMKTLAQVLQSRGWRTGGFTGGSGVDHKFGFDQGFDAYTEDPPFGGFRQSIPKALSWIQANKEDKLFIFLHGYDVHGQYVPPDGYDRRFVDFNYKGLLTGSAKEQKDLREEGITRNHIFLTPDDVRFLVALYDEKIQRADAEFKKFLDAYGSFNVKHKTIFIISADHGEEFYEHGNIDHGHSLYDELLRVPLFIILPGMKQGIRINSQVRSIDLMPTILDLLGVPKTDPIWKQLQGQSLRKTMEGDTTGFDVYPETDYRYAVSLRGLRTTSGWKLIKDYKNNLEELYHVAVDPKEQNNLSKKESYWLPTLKRQLDTYIWGSPSPTGK